MSTEERVVEDLVISVLAVNQYTIERAYDLLAPLRKKEVLNLKALCRWKREEVYDALIASGYDRGAFVNGLLTDRLIALGSFANGSGWAKLLEFLRRGDQSGAEKLLLKVNGVGPTVVRNFWLLQAKLDIM